MMMSRRSLALIGVLAFVAACTAACNVTRLNIAGHAMEPTLKDGESVMGVRDVGELKRGDIIGMRYPLDESKSFVKRIVGLPGERLESQEGRILVNGTALEEPYVAEGNRSKDSWGPLTIEPDKYFVMGDNRRNSSDSRSWGTVRRDAIWARVVDR